MYTLSKNKQIVVLLILLITSLALVSGIYILRYTNKQYYNGILGYLEDCIILHEDDNVAKITKYRGQRCYINKNVYTSSKKIKDQKEFKHKYCIMTFWSFSHFVLYSYIGFFCPSLFLEAFVFNIFFEAYEKFTIEKNDIFDIFYNTIGLILGFLLNKMYFKNDKHTLKSGVIIGVICFLILLILSIQYILQSQKEHDIEYYNNQYKTILNTDDPNDTIYHDNEINNKNKKEILIDKNDDEIGKNIMKKYFKILK